MRLSCERIRRRRLELGLSQRELARQLGEVPNVIKALESGTNHDQLTLVHLDGLATALGVTPQWLLGEQHVACEDEPPQVDRLIALVMSGAERRVPKWVLAARLNLDPAALDAMVDAAQTALAPVGLTFASNTAGTELRLVGAVESLQEDDLAAVIQGINAAGDLDEAIATLIYKVLAGGVTAKEIGASANGRLRLGQAINAGWIEPPEKEVDPLRVTMAVWESLCLDVRL